MDKSEQYIKMCDCEEIQYGYPESDYFYVKHDLRVGDFVAKYIQEWVNIDKETRKLQWYWKVWQLIERDIECYAGIQACFNKESNSLVYLPRQDQLQDMFNLKMPELMDKLYNEIWAEDHGMAIPDWACEKDKAKRNTNIWLFNSWEQLWLAFVMKEKFNKLWDGDKWQIRTNHKKNQTKYLGENRKR